MNRAKTEHLQTTGDTDPFRIKRYMEIELVKLPTVHAVLQISRINDRQRRRSQQRRGIPKLRWKDTVRRDLKAWNIREEWATYRERWKGLCKTRYPAPGDGGESCTRGTLDVVHVRYTPRIGVLYAGGT